MPPQPLLEVKVIADGLWRWTSPHPEWTPEKDRPGGWGRMVGSVYFESPAGEADAIALVDPLAPPADSAESEKFWTALDADVDRAGLPVVIFVGNGYHARGALEFYRRYAGRHGAEIRAHSDAVPRLGFEPTHRFGSDASSRAGVEAFPIEALDVGETALFIRHHRALVFADAVIGAGGGRLAVAPRSWTAESEEAGARYRERFRASLKRMLDLDPAIVLPSHGEPVLTGGRDALGAALDGPAWGE
jgi:glyoxylase-like metal-dependent hydrolase (beta-lactamase superfamily II)